MPDLSTPKGVAKWMKSKGLQKLRWYCELCKKQCRDANGMKCHMQSESHLRNMKLFGQNSGRIIAQNSNAFKHGFLSILQSRYVNRRVFANTVYNEYIADKKHVHMNGTCWTTLSQFVQSLANSGICEIEESERGWYITYTRKDETERRKIERELEMAKSSLDTQERTLKHFEEERKRMEEQLDSSKLEYTKGEDVDLSNGPIFQSLTLQAVEEKPKEVKVKNSLDFFAPLNKSEETPSVQSQPTRSRSRSRSRNRSRSRSRSRHHRSHHHRSRSRSHSRDRREYSYGVNERHNDNWIRKGLLVKVMNETVGNGILYKKKGVILDLIDDFTAKVKVDKVTVKIDQDELQTTVPKEGESACVINGPLINEKVKILILHKDKDYCEAEILTGKYAGKTVRKMYYDDICKESEDA